MEVNVLTKEMKEIIKELGDVIKNDSRYTEFKKSSDAYFESSEVNRKITEYNVHQTALSEEYAKEVKDQAVIESITKRVNELYHEITESKEYVDYVAAKELYDEFMEAVRAEIEFAVSGQKSCSHDCSSCGGCH